jgi:hypothetical protein
MNERAQLWVDMIEMLPFLSGPKNIDDETWAGVRNASMLGDGQSRLSNLTLGLRAVFRPRGPAPNWAF